MKCDGNGRGRCQSLLLRQAAASQTDPHRKDAGCDSTYRNMVHSSSDSEMVVLLSLSLESTPVHSIYQIAVYSL